MARTRLRTTATPIIWRLTVIWLATAEKGGDEGDDNSESDSYSGGGCGEKGRGQDESHLPLLLSPWVSEAADDEYGWQEVGFDPDLT
jgi:hypothetical protein